MNNTEQLVLKLIENDKDKDKFFAPEFTGLYDENEVSRYEITKACFSLVSKGILKRRDCSGLAFEFVNKEN